MTELIIPAYMIPGKPACPFITCTDKKEGVPHYHYFALGEIKTVRAYGPYSEVKT